MTGQRVIPGQLFWGAGRKSSNTKMNNCDKH